MMTDDEIKREIEESENEFRDETTLLFEETLLDRIVSDSEPRAVCIDKFRSLCMYELIDFDAFVGIDEYDKRFIRRWREGKLGFE